MFFLQTVVVDIIVVVVVVVVVVVFYKLSRADFVVVHYFSR